jgi:flagellar basal-body rod protein FlgB
MFGSLVDNITVPLLQRAASFAERRNEVLAGNIANFSTPDYRTRDLPVADFQTALNQALSRRMTNAEGGRPAQWSFSNTAAESHGQPEPIFQSHLLAARDTREPGLTFHDGNNRNAEAELNELVKNSLYQSAAIELMMSQIHRIQAVISERA